MVKVRLGQALTGAKSPVTWDLAKEEAHALLVGKTGKGKTNALFVLLSQCLNRPDLEVCGLDPAAQLFPRLPQSPYRWSLGEDEREPGLACVEVLEALVTRHDGRLKKLRESKQLQYKKPSKEVPLVIIVIDELLTFWAMTSTDRDLAKRAKNALARLLNESRKSLFRVVLAAQVSQKEALGDRVREACDLRILLGSERSVAGLLLPPETPKEVFEWVGRCGVGDALISRPSGLRSFHFDLCRYEEYLWICEGKEGPPPEAAGLRGPLAPAEYYPKRLSQSQLGMWLKNEG